MPRSRSFWFIESCAISVREDRDNVSYDGGRERLMKQTKFREPYNTLRTFVQVCRSDRTVVKLRQYFGCSLPAKPRQPSAVESRALVRSIGEQINSGLERLQFRHLG